MSLVKSSIQHTIVQLYCGVAFDAILTPQYSWNASKVDVKHQSIDAILQINDSVKPIKKTLFVFSYPKF